MFDIGFWELTLIGVIALLVVGPDRLPGMARTLGLWVGRIRRYVAHVKDDIEREIRADELRQMMSESSRIESLDEDLKETRQTLDAAKRDIEEADASLSAESGGREDRSPTAMDDATTGVGKKLSGSDDSGADRAATDPQPSRDERKDDERRSG